MYTFERVATLECCTHFNAYFFNNYAKTHKHIVPRTHAYILRIFLFLWYECAVTKKRRLTQIKQICAIY